MTETTRMICRTGDRRSSPQRLSVAGPAGAPVGAATAAASASAVAAGRPPVPLISATDAAESRNDPASTANAGVGPVAATSTPPSTGPSIEPIWTAVAYRALADVSRDSPISVGMIAIDAGMNSAEHAPSAAATGATAASDDTCSAASTAKTAVSPHRPASEASITSRGPNRSASDPPASVSSARGIP